MQGVVAVVHFDPELDIDNVKICVKCTHSLRCGMWICGVGCNGVGGGGVGWICGVGRNGVGVVAPTYILNTHTHTTHHHSSTTNHPHPP